MKILMILFLFSFLSPKLAMAGCFEAGTELQNIGQIKSVLGCFEEKISTLERKNKILEKQLAKGGGGTVTVNAVKGLPEPQVTMSTVSSKHKIDLLECKRSSGRVKCLFRLTNTGNDIGFRFFTSSKAFDEFGSEFKSGLVTIADMSYDLSQGNGTMKTLISGVPVMGSMVFNNVSKKSTQFVAINIIGGYNALPPFKFRNVAIID